MKVFITASFKDGKNKEEIESLCSLIKESGFEDFCFIRDVENYQKIFENPKELMTRAKKEIEKSDVLLIDMTHKPTGRAIEAGIAFAQNKKIISIMKKGTKIKDTTRGISDAIIEYNEIKEIVKPLNSLFKEWNRNK
jgi:nucleoside 2-deoxyribosyltransferase